MVFPEGTRSYSHEIGRFHKGAFYLAQELHLPVQPIILHGISEVIPKGDFMIFDGHIINIAEPLILPDDERGSEERRVGKSVDLGGGRIIKKKKNRWYE